MMSDQEPEGHITASEILTFVSELDAVLIVYRTAGHWAIDVAGGEAINKAKFVWLLQKYISENEATVGE
jgi:hypothetical protein